MPLPLYPILFPGLESCIPISIQSPFLYYFLLLPPPTLVLLVALPRTSCITIISLQFKRIVSWRIAFLQGWPRICVRLTNMTSLPPVFSSSFFSYYICWIFFFEFVDLFILRRKNVEEECWIGGNEPTKVSRSRWLYLSVLYALLHFHERVLREIRFLESDGRIRTFSIYILSRRKLFLFIKKFKIWWESNQIVLLLLFFK